MRSPEGYCKFFASADPIPIIRAFKFSLPNPGNILVSFHGRLECNQTSGTDVGEVNLSAQIVTDRAAVVDENGPGGLHYHSVLSGNPAVFNLAATRVISYSTAGSKTVRFKMSRVFQNASV